MAHNVARVLTNGADERVCFFLKTLIDLFRVDNFDSTLDFFIASFSRECDDLGQWRAGLGKLDRALSGFSA